MKEKLRIRILFPHPEYFEALIIGDVVGIRKIMNLGYNVTSACGGKRYLTGVSMWHKRVL